jgi:hypothetical protein
MLLEFDDLIADLFFSGSRDVHERSRSGNGEKLKTVMNEW